MRHTPRLLVVVAFFGLLNSVCAQEVVDGVIYSRFRQFRIPFQTSEVNIKSLQLYVSTDQGYKWVPSSTASPEQGGFKFFSQGDGAYWFAVQTIDREGRATPPTIENVQPNLKVVVDTQPPVVTLQALPAQNGQVGIQWDARDEFLDWNLREPMTLEYRPAGTTTWLPLRIPPTQKQHYWTPHTTGPVEVRLRVSDRARNWGEALTTATLNGGVGSAQGLGFSASPAPTDPSPGSNPQPQQEIYNAPPQSERRFVNSTRVSLHYNLENLGPSGLSYVELWYTLDGRNWSKYPVKFGEDPKQRNIAFDVAREGLYGISLVAKSGVGLGDPPPKSGDRPQIWIEVDSTRPATKLHNVIVGQGADKGKLTILWTAQDINLAREPITLSYSESASGPWTPIAQKLPNTGRYVWSMPEGVPYQFHVKVEAADLATNVGEAVTDTPVKVDLSHPRAVPTLVEPANK